MQKTFKLIKPWKTLAMAGFLWFSLCPGPIAANTQPGPIVVTIKPLYSLVAHLSEGLEPPVLLMKQAQSPHHYNMRPSERRLLAKASIIVWLGPQLEPYLQKVIEQQTSTVITAIHAKQLKLLPIRNKHSHDDDNEHADNTGTEARSNIDPHIWMSTHNAAAISKHIAAQLITQDPDNADLFKHNLERLLNKIKQTRDFINIRLKNSKQPFIAYHDAFQYFEKENALNFIDAINFDDETGTSLKHIRKIKASIDEYNIQCLVYQAPKPAILKVLTKQQVINTTALDPLGISFNDDKNAWFELMQQLALNFNACLNSPNKH